jgi:hypothetical protein
MIYCKCGKAIEKLPTWLSSANVEFVCNNCPNRQTKNIAFVNLEPSTGAAKMEDEKDVEEEADDDES